MASVLTIAGTTVDRVATRAVLTRLHLSLDEYSELEFSELATTSPGRWHPGQSVLLSVDGVPKFNGQVVGRHPRFTGTGWTIGYHCLGLKYLGNLIALTNPNDLTGTLLYNLPSDDPDYVSSSSGLAVGTILQRVLDGHATALAAVGIAGYVATDLTPLTVVPPEPITLQGPHLFNVIDGFLDQWSGIYVCSVEWNVPTSDWRVRIRDTTAFTPTTLTAGIDPIEPPEVNRDTTDSYSRVLVRGRGEIEPWYGSTLVGNLTPAWSGADQTAWTWNDFSQPKGATDQGNITALSATTVTVTSSDATRTWAVNYWSGVGAWCYVINAVAAGLTQLEARKVIANTALTAGGTSVLTLDRALNNSGYTTYRIVGQPSNSKADVWRRYSIGNTQVAAHLARKFPIAVPWSVASMMILTNYPIAEIDAAGAGYPWPFELDPVAGQIRFVEPVVKAFNTQANLNSGGASVTAPDDVKVLVPYSRGTLAAAAPADVGGVPQYAGTSSTVDGIQRTYTIDVPTWISAADTSRLQALAAMQLAAVQDSVLTGSVTYHGKYTPGLTFGIALNFAGDGYTTGLEAINVPVREVTLEYPAEGADNWRTILGFSNRRKPGTGESLYLPVPWDRPPLESFAGGGGGAFGYELAGGAEPGAMLHESSATSGFANAAMPDLPSGPDMVGAGGSTAGFPAPEIPGASGTVGAADQAAGNWTSGAGAADAAPTPGTHRRGQEGPSGGMIEIGANAGIPGAIPEAPGNPENVPTGAQAPRRGAALETWEGSRKSLGQRRRPDPGEIIEGS